MKVFISWSGERSKALAHALRDWLPLVLHYVEPWLSEADIGAGERWAEAIAKELEASNFGITCITRENMSSPWVLFEAGALAKSLQGSRVIPLLLDLEFREITGPLAQFQAKKLDKVGLTEVVVAINKVASSPIPDTRANQLFEALWPTFEATTSQIPKQPTPTRHARPQHEILEELVTSVRSLDARFREGAEESPRAPKHRRRRFHPMMAMELAHMMGDRPGDPIGLLILASMLREEVPWLYELALEAYRAVKAGSTEDAERAMFRFQRATDMLDRGPLPAEELGIDPKALHMISRELRHMVRLEPHSNDDGEAKAKAAKSERKETGAEKSQ